MLPLRICIYPKDVAVLIGRSYDSAKRLLHQARAAAGKPIGALLSVANFFYHIGLGEHEVTAALNCRGSAANSDRHRTILPVTGVFQLYWGS